MQVKLQDFQISGIAGAVPADKQDLAQLGNSFGNDEVQRIMKGTGIREVRVAPDTMCTSDLCCAAAEKLLDVLPRDRNTIDGLVFVSQTPDWTMPPTAPALQDRLGLSRKIVAFDINYGCSGFVYGLFQAGMLIQTGACKRVLLCVGDTSSKLVNPQDKQVRMVFGDGATATLVEYANDKQWPFVIGTDGSQGDALIIPAGGCRQPHSEATRKIKEDDHGNRRTDEDLYMDGMEIMNFSLREVPPTIERLLDMQNWSRNEVNVYALHQANKFMVDYLRRKMKLSREAVPLGIQNLGNTGPASIPLLLVTKHQHLQHKRGLTKTVMCGFGVGLSWAATAGDLSQTRFPDLIELS